MASKADYITRSLSKYAYPDIARMKTSHIQQLLQAGAPLINLIIWIFSKIDSRYAARLDAKSPERVWNNLLALGLCTDKDKRSFFDSTLTSSAITLIITRMFRTLDDIHEVEYNPSVAKMKPGAVASNRQMPLREGLAAVKERMRREIAELKAQSKDCEGPESSAERVMTSIINNLEAVHNQLRELNLSECQKVPELVQFPVDKQQYPLSEEFYTALGATAGNIGEICRFVQDSQALRSEEAAAVPMPSAETNARAKRNIEIVSYLAEQCNAITAQKLRSNGAHHP